MSAAPKFTPGPWQACKSYATHGDVDGEMMNLACSVTCHAPFVDDVEGSDQYGETFDEQACARAYGRTKEEMAANARLIAAAPELYEALEQMVEIAELTVGWLPTPPGADGPLIKARAALAKARGEQ